MGSNTWEVHSVYVGDDEGFARRWSAISESLGASFIQVAPGQADEVALDGGIVLLVDGEVLQAGVMGRMTGLGWRRLAVLAWGEEAGPIPGWSECDDILIKSAGDEVLRKRLEFYVSCLSTARPGDQDEDKQYLQTNRNLRDKVVRLREQLGVADTHLQMRQEVLNKIEQISSLSRQINCLNLDQIASVCIESIPKLIAARFASLYRYDADSEVLHLLRHNHPYKIHRMVVASQHPRSPMVTTVKQKELMLMKSSDQWAQDDGERMARQFTKNYQTNSCIIAPLLSGDKVMGVLNLADKMDGPNFERTKAMADAVDIDVIAAGGVTSVDDITRLKDLGIAGAIIGRALYESKIDLKEAITAGRQE